MSYPTIIAGPAVVQFNGQSYYTEQDIVINHRRETFAIATSHAGVIDTRLSAQMAEASFKPVGALDVVAKYLPYAASQIGSLLIDPASLKPLTIWTKAGVKTVWANGFISKLPSFSLSALRQAIGPMSIVALGDPTKTLVDAAAWNVVSSSALADTTFDETKIVTPQYKATWGAIFTDLESEDGFTFEPVMSIAMKRLDNYGYVNALLTDLVCAVRFKPVGRTEAQLWSDINLQGSGAIVPGASVTGASDLVISAGAISFTLPKAGPVSAVTQYGLQNLRFGEMAFVNRKTWSAGALQANFSVAFS